MNLLSNEEISDIVAWLPHGRGFIIQNKKRFELEVLPKYFKEAKYTSFNRRLKRWNFIIQRHGHKKAAYFHPEFIRDDTSKICEMVPSPQRQYNRNRKKAKKAKAAAATATNLYLFSHSAASATADAMQDPGQNTASDSPEKVYHFSHHSSLPHNKVQGEVSAMAIPSNGVVLQQIVPPKLVLPSRPISNSSMTQPPPLTHSAENVQESLQRLPPTSISAPAPIAQLLISDPAYASYYHAAGAAAGAPAVINNNNNFASINVTDINTGGVIPSLMSTYPGASGVVTASNTIDYAPASAQHNLGGMSLCILPQGTTTAGMISAAPGTTVPGIANFSGNGLWANQIIIPATTNAPSPAAFIPSVVACEPQLQNSGFVQP